MNNKYFTRSSTQRLSWNAQNQHIAASFECCNFAVLKLMEMDIAVAEIMIGGIRPLITVLESRHCERLNPNVFATLSQGSGAKSYTKRAEFMGCLVQWESRYHH